MMGFPIPCQYIADEYRAAAMRALDYARRYELRGQSDEASVWRRLAANDLRQCHIYTPKGARA